MAYAYEDQLSQKFKASLNYIAGTYVKNKRENWISEKCDILSYFIMQWLNHSNDMDVILSYFLYYLITKTGTFCL